MVFMKLVYELGELDMVFGIIFEIVGELKDEGKIVEIIDVGY